MYSTDLSDPLFNSFSHSYFSFPVTHSLLFLLLCWTDADIDTIFATSFIFLFLFQLVPGKREGEARSDQMTPKDPPNILGEELSKIPPGLVPWVFFPLSFSGAFAS